MREFLSDLGYAARSLRRSPGFAAAAILLLALGIGANALVFSLVDGILVRALPFRDPARLTAIWETTRSWDPKIFACYRDIETFARQSRSFASLAGWQWVEFTLTGQGDPRRVLGEAVTPRFFEVLGIRAAQGRTFGMADTGGGPVVVLSDTGWKSILGGARDAIGKHLILDGRPHTVVGIMPPGFEFYPRQALFWELLTPEESSGQAGAKAHAMGGVGRLSAGVSMATAESELAGMRAALETADPDDIQHAGVMVRSLRDEFTWLAGRNLRSGLLLLFGAVGFVLLIACANVANLLIGRALERRREIAIRTALGSGRSRLIRQILTENLLLSTLGAMAGVALAFAGVRYLRTRQPLELPPGAAVSLNWMVLAFAGGLSVLTAAISGLMPAFQASRFELNDVLKESARGASAGRAAQRSRSLLVIFEVALSLTLLSGAALLIESLLRLRSEPLGFNVEGLLTARFDLPKATYPALQDRVLFCDRLPDALGGLPGLRVSLRSSGLTHVEVAGSRVSPRENGFVSRDVIGPDYFAVTGIPLVGGREFTTADTEHAEPVAIVDREFARRYSGGENPMGKHIRLGGTASPWRTIVGEAGDIKETNVFDEMHWSVTPHAYLPLHQGAPKDCGRWTLMIRAGSRWLGAEDRPLGALESGLRHSINRIDPSLPVSEITSMRQFLDEQAFSKPGFRAVLLAVFAALALVMAAIGLYGVLSQFVTQRSHEMGVRMALGATPREVVHLVVRRSLVLTAAGIVIGGAAAAAAMRLLRVFIIADRGVLLIIPAVTLLMLSIALIAGIVPAWRAGRTDPAVALREE
jgi:putative ABC transport system permease protein